MGLFDSKSESSSTTTNKALEQYAEGSGVNAGEQARVAMAGSTQVLGSSKYFAAGSDYARQYQGATVLQGGAIQSSGAGNTLTINAPDQMFELLEQVVLGSNNLQAETLGTVRSMQTAAEDRITKAIELSERVSTQTGEVIAFIKQAAPFAFIGAVIYIGGKKLLKG